MTVLRCSVCAVPLWDDPHFDNDTQAPLCDEHCACLISVASLGGDAATAGTPSSAVASPQTEQSPAVVCATPGS